MGSGRSVEANEMAGLPRGGADQLAHQRPLDVLDVGVALEVLHHGVRVLGADLDDVDGRRSSRRLAKGTFGRGGSEQV